MKNRLIAGLVALTALGAGLVGPATATSTPPDPTTDPFLKAPANLASLAPGTLIRSRAVSSKVIGAGGLSIPMQGTSRQILVRSADSHGRPVAVTATVITPSKGVRHQLLAYDIAINSLGSKCEPSYELQTGGEVEAALVAGFVAKGLTVVVPDHEGPRNSYGAGRMAGHATLDSIRGALALPSSRLTGANTPVGAVGYSGGAIAAGWAAQLQPTYAPELNMVGVVSGGTPADVAAAARAINGGAFGGLGIAASLGVMREYPELRSILNAKGLAMADKVKDMCLTQLSARAFDRIEKYTVMADPLSSPVAKAVLADNKMGATPPTMPYLLWHSKFDQLIPWSSVDALDKQWCGEGADIQFVTNRTSEHVSGVFEMYPTAVSWLMARFDGKPFTTGNCPT